MQEMSRNVIYLTDPSLLTLLVLELGVRLTLFSFQEILGGGIPSISIISVLICSTSINIYFKYYKQTEMNNSLSFTGNLKLLILFSRVTIY